MENLESVAIETQQVVDAPAQVNEEGYERDLLAEEWQDFEPAVEETAVDAPEAAEQPQREEVVKEQTRIDHAMYAEKKRVEDRTRREMMQHPAYLVGNRMLNQIMQAHNTDINGARDIFEKNYFASIAQEEGISENLARAVYGKDIEPMPAPEKTMDDHAAAIRDEIASANLPEGFDFNSAIGDEDKRFAQLLWRSRENPAELAAMVYHLEKKVESAPQEMADKIRARQAIPQPIKAAPTNPNPNLWAMSDEEFEDYMRTH